jgi:hypothetical protein
MKKQAKKSRASVPLTMPQPLVMANLLTTPQSLLMTHAYINLQSRPTLPRHDNV